MKLRQMNVALAAVLAFSSTAFAEEDEAEAGWDVAAPPPEIW